jgi:DNA-binding beta-propeller fold protein YncE
MMFGETRMKRFSLLHIAAALLSIPIFVFLGTHSRAESNELLRLVQTISIPKVKGRLDHLDVDVKGQRLFVSALENGTVEAVSLGTGKWIRSIPGFKKPQGISYVPSLNKLFIASGDDGMVRVFRGDTFELIDSIQLELGPNRVAYDSHAEILYVGYGGKDAGKDYGEVALIDAKRDTKIRDIQVAAHPAELLLDKSGQTLFVLVPISNEIQVVDTKTGRIISTWPVTSQRPGDAALDDANHRLFIGTHTPPEMIAMDSRTGKEVAALPTVEGMDGVYFDARRQRAYVSGGRGFDVGSVYVYQRHDGDHYNQIATLATRAGAGTSFWSPELDRYFVAAPAHDNEDTAILVYQPQP